MITPKNKFKDEEGLNVNENNYAREEDLKELVATTEIVANQRIFNFSVDDFELALKDITDNEATYTSIYDNSTFLALKELHNTYGAKTICMCYTNNAHDISLTTSKFKAEFEGASSWLKFAFHSVNSTTFYDEVTVADFKIDYDNFLASVANFAGNSSISKTIRFHSFRASTDVLAELANTYDVKTIYSADDDRTIIYDFTLEERKSIGRKYINEKNGITFVKTPYRIDSLVSTDVVQYLNQFHDIKVMGVFLHEGSIAAQGDTINEVMKWAIGNDYSFSDFQGITNGNYLRRMYLPEDITTYIMQSSWSIRSGNELYVRKIGNVVSIVGQAQKTSTMVNGDVCLTLPERLQPNQNLISYCLTYPSSGDGINLTGVIIDTGGNVVLGYRDLIPDNDTIVAFNVTYSISE